MSILSPKKPVSRLGASTTKYAEPSSPGVSSAYSRLSVSVSKEETPKRKEVSRTPPSPSPASPSTRASPAPLPKGNVSTPPPRRSAYESPHSPIASAVRRSTARPKLRTDAVPTTPSTPSKHVAPKKLTDSPSYSSTEAPTAALPALPPLPPAASAASASASSSAASSAQTARPTEAKTDTLFSPAYLRHLEERDKAVAEGKARPFPAGYRTGIPPLSKYKRRTEHMHEDDDFLDDDEFDPFLFIKSLPPLSQAVKDRKSPIPRKICHHNITLALDLDETLVHCSVQPIDKAEMTFSVNFNGIDYEVFVRTRPHLQTFLKTVSEWFEVVIFTASQRVYADRLLNILDPHKKFIKHRVFRDSCVCVDGNYLKDLHILGRDMKKVAIVDNSVQAFGFQLDNGIPIESWFDDDHDQELLNLLPFLAELKDARDVRPLIRQTFRLQEFVNSL